MERRRGFSLLHVLVALLIFSQIVVVILHQQWASLQALRRFQARFLAVSLLDHMSEAWLAGDHDISVDAPYTLQFEADQFVLTWFSSIGKHRITREIP